jgi:hypothetical protein
MHPLTKPLSPPGHNADIETRALVERYGEVAVSAGPDLTVSEGTVFG